MPPRQKKIRGGAVITKDTLIITLAPGQSIKTSPGAMIYMRGDINKGDVNVGPLSKAFGRMFSGENFFLTNYTSGAKGGTIALGLSFPGDIVQINLKPDESYRISKGCFLASTPNVEIAATVQAKGFISIGQEEGMVLPVVKCDKGTQGGIVWLGGYGSFERHELVDASDAITVDNGIFLACPNEMQYELVKLGKTLLSSFVGGEGIGMKFVGPGVVYTQSKNFNDFKFMMGQTPPTTVTGELANKAADVAAEGIWDRIVGNKGGARRRHKQATI